MEEYAMPLEFDIKLEPRDMYRFNMYQTYSGVSGVSSILFAAAIFGMAVYTYGEVSLPNTIMPLFYTSLMVTFIRQRYFGNFSRASFANGTNCSPNCFLGITYALMRVL